MESGTGRAQKIEGIVVCGKTGTVENSYKGVKQKDHAFFAAFAPRENPRIAIAVICENAGFGASSAAPIASLMIEKYLKDSITDKSRLAKVEAISKLNLMPARIYKELRIRDSIVHSKDSAYLISKGYLRIMKDTLGIDEVGVDEAVNEVNSRKKAPKTQPKAEPEIQIDSKPVNENFPPKTAIPPKEAMLPEKKKLLNDSSKHNMPRP